MPTLADQVRRRAHVYVAHGGKRNRRQQVDRLVILANWIQAHFRVTGLEQIGKRQVIGFGRPTETWHRPQPMLTGWRSRCCGSGWGGPKILHRREA
jgi:hypothetical protein